MPQNPEIPAFLYHIDDSATAQYRRIQRCYRNIVEEIHAVRPLTRLELDDQARADLRKRGETAIDEIRGLLDSILGE